MNHPDKLKVKLQEAIDAIVGFDKILLSYGLCGYAIIRLHASTADLLYGCTDDCISGVLHQNDNYSNLRKIRFY